MSTTTNLDTLTINYLTQAQYDAEVQAGTIDEDAIYMTPNEAVDYIVEQATIPGWTYRKWNSGVAECWNFYTWTITGWTAWGNTYYSTGFGPIDYPDNLFITQPAVTADGHASSGDAWLAGGGGANGGTDTATPMYFLMRSTAGTNNITGYVHIHAIGRWK